jgi:hypothetical protein
VPRGIEHATCQKRALVSSCAPWHRVRHPEGKGSGVTMCCEASCAPPARKGLRCCHVTEAPSPSPGRRGLQSHHVPRGSRLTPLRRKALASLRDRGTRTTAWQGSSIATCPEAPEPSPGAGGLRSHHVPSGSRPRACPCVLKMPDIRLIMASPGT